MDESWRMRIGLNYDLPRRRSTEETSSDHRNSLRRSVFGCLNSDSESTTTTTTTKTTSLDPENFNDVFGGPPRSIVSRQFSGDLNPGNNKSSSCNNSNNTFYEEIFRSSEFVAQAKNNGKKLPGFTIPGRISGGGGGGGGGLRRSELGFYDDIFGSDNEDHRRWKSSESKWNDLNYSKSKSKSKSNSSSVLSSEELSPLRPSIAEDVFFSSLSSKLRPINVPGRRNSSSMLPLDEEQMSREITSSDCPWINNHPVPLNDHQFMDQNYEFNENYRMSSSRFGFSHCLSSPETITIEPNSYRSSIKFPIDDPLDLDSPSSVVSLHRDLEPKIHQDKKNMQEQVVEEEEEISSSYVIEFTSSHKNIERTKGEAISIDEAIAWAKEKFQTHQNLEVFEGAKQQQMILRSSPAEPTTERANFLTKECLDQQ